MPELRFSSPRRHNVCPMRRLIPALALLLTLAGVAAVAVTIRDRAEAAATGTIRGRVMNETTGEAQAGVELTLTTGTEDGSSETVATIRSDSRGRYRFADLATGDDRFYALDARYEGGLFAGRPITLPSDTTRLPVVDSTMRVWDTTSDPAVIAVKRDDLFAVANEDGLGVIQSVTILNNSDRAYIGRGAEMVGTTAASGVSLAFALPPGASDVNVFDSDLDMPEIVPVDQGFGTTVAFPPGETRTTFSYLLSGVGGSFDLSRPALYTTLELSIFAAPPLEIESNRLVPGEGVTLEGKRYERWTAEDPIEAGDPLQALAIARSDASSLPLVAAIAGVLVVVMAIGAVARARRRDTPRVTPSPAEREGLLEEVARLDLDFAAGAIGQPQYDDQRADLIGRLKKLERQP